MTFSLESKIKSLLQSKGELQEAVLVTATEGEQVQVVDGSNMTGFAQDQLAMANSAPDQTKVTEEAVIKGEEDGSEKTAKIQAGEKQADPAPAALGDTAQPDAADPQANADNQKIQAGKANQDKPLGALQQWLDNDENGFKQVNQSTGLNEHMAALFNGEELSEEFMSKANTIFEAAVNTIVSERVAQLEEEYQLKLEEQQEAMQADIESAVEEVSESMVNEVDKFLSRIVENWVGENKIAIESGLQVEMTNSFIDGLKTLFREHYVEVPDSKIDVVLEQKQELEVLSVAAAGLQEENDALAKELAEVKAQLTFESVSRGLTAVQKEKFRTLSEGVEFTTAEQYATKLETLKESYFSNKVSAQVEQPIVESVQTNDAMAKYASVISKNLKFI